MTSQTDQGRRFVKALGALLAAAIFAYLVFHVAQLLREPDLWWHIKTGQWMIAHHGVTQTDPFSYTHAGQPWVAKEWLSQVIYALVFEAAGWAGPLLLAAAAAALTGWLIYVSTSRSMQPIFAAALVILTLLLIQGTTVARPHILTFPILAAFTMLMFDAARGLRAPTFWSLLLILLWTNLHGSFSIAFIVSGAAFLDYLERSRLKGLKTIALWIAYFALAGLVTLINPYFIKPHLIALSMAGGIDSMSRISEWAPFTAPDNSILEGGILLVLFLLLKARAKLTFGQIIFTLMVLHMMLDHLRFLYVFFIALPIVLVPEITESVPALSLQRWLARPRDGLERFAGNSVRLLQAVAALAIVGVCIWQVSGDHVVPPEKTAISGALAYVAEHRPNDPALQAHVFNDYNFGGPLIMAGILTYIDGRSEQLFLGDFILNYLKAVDPGGKDALAKILTDAQIGWVILPAHGPAADNMNAIEGWKQVYADDVAAIWEPAKS